MITCVLGRYVVSQSYRRVPTASVDSCAEIKSAHSLAGNQFWQSLEEGAGKRCSECGTQLAVAVQES